MTLQHVVEEYATFRKTLGERFRVNGQVLKAFCKAMGHGIALADVAPERVRLLSDGSRAADGLVACQTQRPCRLLPVCDQPWIRRPFSVTPGGAQTTSSIPAVYLLSRRTSPSDRCHRFVSTQSRTLEPLTVKTLLLLMYAAALRTSEVLSLTIADVDLPDASSQFASRSFSRAVSYRLVLRPLKILSLMQTVEAIGSFPWARVSLLCGRNGKKINMDTFGGAFPTTARSCRSAPNGGPRCQPRLHDLRHTSAVHRLTAWYREGKDVQLLLPQLSVCMGRTYLAATQMYLTMTPELLHEASLRFELYAGREGAS